MTAPAHDRVATSTSPMVNLQIKRRTDINIHYYQSHREEIDPRLWELDREWDVERVVQVWTAGLTLVCLFVAFFSFIGVVWAVVVQGFFVLHALQGWCPSTWAFRKLGFRTVAEIGAEREALKALQSEPVIKDPVAQAEIDALKAAAKMNLGPIEIEI